jgi:hypothetical protein
MQDAKLEPAPLSGLGSYRMRDAALSGGDPAAAVLVRDR